MTKIHRVLRSLPFEPMALSTFETIERAKQSPIDVCPLQANILHPPPYFISPKHDGVRVVSYVGKGVETLKSTCFSRFGRPIHGMFWIEEELRLLRWLCGDPRLILDGELYIHKAPGSGTGDKDRAKTGFLAVSALVHRLRGHKSACSTEEEVLRYVSSLPLLCVFDIVSYQPSGSLRVSGNNNDRGLSQIEKERVSLLLEVMRANSISDLEMLRVIPNYSVFSQRLKAMHFLTCLLQHARSSPILFPSRTTNTASETKSEGRRNHTITDDVNNIGGKFVKLVRYSLLHTLNDAQRVYLKKYLSTGYEGAVVRCATNVYEMREKKKGVLQGLLEPLLSSGEHPITPVKVHGGSRGIGRRTDAPQLLYTYAMKETLVPNHSNICGGTPNAKEVERMKEEHMDHQKVVEVAMGRCRTNGRRSATAVKLLPFCDKEFAILKPLLKIPSNESQIRDFVSVSLSTFNGDRSVITTPRTHSGRATARKKSESDVVVFYGLQCLSETGRVFNVPLPKMNASNQQALLGHLLEAMGIGKGKGKPGVRCVRRRSLTGLYATVVYPSLTEYGVPRFGQVKAIRGGRGWFL